VLVGQALSVAVGAALGALLRWMLGVWFNPLFATVPLGTLAANLLGGYLVGVAVSVFTTHAGLPPELRLFVITGFLGGLTTFSTFSAEVVSLVQEGQWGWGLAAAGAHLVGSLVLTLLGMASGQMLMRALAAS
jgi:CrcB protein